MESSNLEKCLKTGNHDSNENNNVSDVEIYDDIFDSLAAIQLTDPLKENVNKLDRKNPAYIPKKGKFYEHDNRLDSTDSGHK